MVQRQICDVALPQTTSSSGVVCQQPICVFTSKEEKRTPGWNRITDETPGVVPVFVGSRRPGHPARCCTSSAHLSRNMNGFQTSDCTNGHISSSYARHTVLFGTFSLIQRSLELYFSSSLTIVLSNTARRNTVTRGCLIFFPHF